MVRRVLTLVIVALTAALAGPSTSALGSSAYRYDASAAAALHFGDPGATSTTPTPNGEGGAAGTTTDSAGASRGEAVALRLVVAAEEGAGPPSSSPNFVEPTNSPQAPPTDLPPGYSVRVMGPTEQYPDGYWVETNENGQPVVSRPVEN
jgi:hypothetical protein